MRRGGYDTAAVDKHLRTLTAEKAGLAASLTEAQARLKALGSEVESLRTKVDENENPTYAGLGGKASEILRLAEEQAQEVLASARTRADEIVRKANHEAGALKNQASRDADDVRMTQLKELDEARAKAMGEVERLRSSAETGDVFSARRNWRINSLRGWPSMNCMA